MPTFLPSHPERSALHMNNIIRSLLIVRYRLPKHPRSARQCVTISGLGSQTFDDALNCILQIRNLFANVVPANALQVFSPRRPGGMLELEFGNRYFSNDDANPGFDGKALDDIVDPLRILTDLCPRDLASSDNEVLYFERRRQASGYDYPAHRQQPF